MAAEDFTKRCAWCCERKPYSAFSKDRRASDGLQSSCLSCCSSRRRAAYANNPEKFRKAQRDYNASHKELVAAIAAKSRERRAEKIKAEKREWYKRSKDDPERRARAANRRAATKAEKKEYDRWYRVKNREKLRQRKEIWRAKNATLVRSVRLSYKARRRATEAVGDSPAKVAEWMACQSLVCRWCGVDCSGAFHVDHVTPLSRGGSHTIDNLCISCPPCNIRKNARDPAEWMARLSGIGAI